MTRIYGLHLPPTAPPVVAALLILWGLAAAGEVVLPSPAPIPAGRDFGDFGDFSDFESLGGDGGDVDPVTFSLLAEGYPTAGRPFRLALVLKHAPGYYSYWRNPGESGAPPRWNWKLPDGFAIDGPQWPAPKAKTAAGQLSYVMDGNDVLLFTLRPPEVLPVGTEVEISVHLRVLACSAQSCMPVEQTLAIDLRAIDLADFIHAPTPPHENIAAFSTRPPAAPKGWRFALENDNGGWALTMTPAADKDAKPNPEPGAVGFFEADYPDSFFAPQVPAVPVKTENGWRLPLTRRADDDAPPRLPAAGVGAVLTAANGWRTDTADVRAFQVTLPPPSTRKDTGGGGDADAGANSGANANAGADADEISYTGKPLLRNRPLMWLLAYLGGLILNIMPCVFPVLGLKVMSMVRHAHEQPRAMVAHGLAYTGGVLICFWVLAAVAIFLGRAWGAQLQSPALVFVMTHIFLVLALNMAGVFEVGSPNVGRAGEEAARQTGARYSFFTGVLATITSTPCSAPFLGTALAYALALPVGMALGVFTIMALGFATPYLLLTIFPAGLRKLPRPGSWMETFRRAMCFPLFGTAAYMAWVFDGLAPDGLLPLLLGMVLVAFGCWLFGHHQQAGEKSARRRRAGWAAALVCVLLGLWWGLPRAAKIDWEPWSPERVAALREQGRTVYVDFTARWCPTCQVNKWVFDDPGVLKSFREGGVALLRADWTDYDPRITKTLRDEFNKAAIPVNVVYRPDRGEALLLPELLTAASVREAVAPDD